MIHGYDKDRYLARLNRLTEAQALPIAQDHLPHCVVNAARAGGEEAEAKIAEANAAIARLVKS